MLDVAPQERSPVIRHEELRRVASVAPAPSIESGDLSTFVDEEQEHGDSDVFVCRRSAPDPHDESQDDSHDEQDQGTAAAAAVQHVTLYVYGWHNVEPGPLSWVFPSLRTALDAVRTMRNAVQWCIVSGEWPTVDAARTKGAVLIEQLG